VDLLHFAAQIPSIPVQRRMDLADVVAAREAIADRPCWPAIFIKAFARVSDDFPPLRRAYVQLPWPHLCEYPTTVASLAVGRQYQNDPCVFFVRFLDPAALTLRDLHSRIRQFATDPVESVRQFRKMLSISRWPRAIRRALLWFGLNFSRTRPNYFGTFGLSVYSSLGAESLHPLAPLSSTLTYGTIDSDGSVWVRLIYDHRVFDGATTARALAMLEEVLTRPILAELREMASDSRVAA
jgi:hypothetical protein